MIMLKSTHKTVVTDFKKVIIEKEQEIARSNDELSVQKKVSNTLENRNCQLHTRLIAADEKVERYYQANIRQQEIVKNLESELDKSKKENAELKFCANENKKEVGKLRQTLKINGIAKKQLRDLISYKDNEGKAMQTKQNTLVHERVDGVKVWELTVLLGE